MRLPSVLMGSMMCSRASSGRVQTVTASPVPSRGLVEMVPVRPSASQTASPCKRMRFQSLLYSTTLSGPDESSSAARQRVARLASLSQVS